METEYEVLDDDFLFYSLLYSSITVVFAMAVLSKFLTNEFRFGFRAVLSLGILFIGEPLCHFLLKGPSGVAIFGIGCLFVYYILPASHLPAQNKAVLITGCDSGFGHALCMKLDSIGMTVYAGCLYKNSPGAIELQHTCSERLKVIQLDVTKQAEINQALEFIKQQTPEGEGLWGLVNNAGVFYASNIEMTPEVIWRRSLDVNLMGMIRITKAFLPLIRKAKGRIVNISSLTGKVAFESFGAYCVTKHAIEAYSDVLRLEMKKWDVMVSVVQPSGYKTAAVNENVIRERKEEIWKNLDESTQKEYGREFLDKMYENFEAAIPRYPTDVTPVVRAIRSGLLSKVPMERFMVGSGSGVLLSLFPVLPIWIADKVSYILGCTSEDLVPASLQKKA